MTSAPIVAALRPLRASQARKRVTARQGASHRRTIGTDIPAGWKRFYAIRNVSDENEIVTFGFFDGTLEELRASQTDNGEYEQRRAAAEEFVESVGADGVFEVVEERSME